MRELKRGPLRSPFRNDPFLQSSTYVYAAMTETKNPFVETRSSSPLHERAPISPTTF